MKLLNIAILIGAFAVFAPTPPQTAQTPDGMAQTAVTMPHLLGAAYNTASDINGFCGRQPEVCEATQTLADHLLAKVKYSTKLLYEWANDKDGA